MKFLDCTFRDGGYYNSWDFPIELAGDYLEAMRASGVDIVEIGFRFLNNNGFKGAFAFSQDKLLESLSVPQSLSLGVMINGSDLCTELGTVAALGRLFPLPADESAVDIVRIACHFHELQSAFDAAEWLHERGYVVGVNLMQIADRSESEIRALGKRAGESPVSVLYFADSMGSMTPEHTSEIIRQLREGWNGDLGIHTHDNMGLALSNTLRAHEEGVAWLDSTVTGMGRGPGNARTEELAIEIASLRGENINLVPLMKLIREHFGSMRQRFGWGSNPYYYLSGKYGIHPTYIQEMLGDARYDEEDILAVIDHLRMEGGKKFSFNTLDGARQFYRGEPRGIWSPSSVMDGRTVLILGSGPGVVHHQAALEDYIRRERPVVMALNTQTGVAPELIDLRIACHPVRLLADAETHAGLPQPLITPASMLPEALRGELGSKELLDFGLGIESGCFEFHESHCIAPSSLVLAYALAVASSGNAPRILLAGFDGYSPGDVRNDEVEAMLSTFVSSFPGECLMSITPTRYKGLQTCSVYGL